MDLGYLKFGERCQPLTSLKYFEKTRGTHSHERDSKPRPSIRTFQSMGWSSDTNQRQRIAPQKISVKVADLRTENLILDTNQ